MQNNNFAKWIHIRISAMIKLCSLADSQWHAEPGASFHGNCQHRQIRIIYYRDPELDWYFMVPTSSGLSALGCWLARRTDSLDNLSDLTRCVLLYAFDTREHEAVTAALHKVEASHVWEVNQYHIGFKRDVHLPFITLSKVRKRYLHKLSRHCRKLDDDELTKAWF